MELETLIREADPVRCIDPVNVESEDAQELYQQITEGRSRLRISPTGSSASAGSWTRGLRSINGRHLLRAGPRKWAVGAAAVLVFVGFGAAYVMAVSDGGPLRTSAAIGRVSTVWRLVSAVGPAIRPFESTVGSPQGLRSLTCPTARICYLISSTTSTGRPPDAAFRSTDGGMSWASINLPSGVFLDTSFSCVSAASCMVGAESGIGSAVDGSNVAQLLLTTNDRGESWTTHPVPMTPIRGADAALNQTISSLQGSLDDLHCFSLKSCIAFGTTPADQAEGGSDGRNPISQTVAMRTNDDGATWSTHVFPWSTTPNGDPGWSNAQRAAFSCPTEQSCVGLATVLAAPNYSHTFQMNGNTYRGGQESSLLEFRTSDAGASWSQTWVSGVQGFVEALTCPDQNHCLAVAQVGKYAPPGPTDVVTTTDGGATWEPRQVLPAQNPSWDSLRSISCPTINACWIAGSQQSSTNPSLSQGAMFATQNRGQTWLPVTLPTGLGSVGEIDCISVRACLAVGQPPMANGAVSSSGPIPSDVLTNRSRSR
jgi:hypothetical protein